MFRIIKNALRFPFANTAEEKFSFEFSETSVDIFSEGATKTCFGELLLINSLPEVFSQKYGHVPDRIYVRECYKTLYERAALSRIRGTDHYNVTLYTGVPGIGKSIFLVYFICRFLTDKRFLDKCFALEFNVGAYICFQPTGTAGELFCSIQMASYSHPLNKRFLLLCDISEEKEPATQWMYISCVPRPVRYKQITKNAPGAQHMLPTWSQLELSLLSADIAAWYDRFVLFGGVPRSIFFFGGRSQKHLRLKALWSKGPAIAEFSFKYGYGWGMGDCEESYWVLQVNQAMPTAQVGECSKWQEYSFASDATFQWLVKHHRAVMLAGAIALFNGGPISKDDGALFFGHLFAMVCLWLCPLQSLSLPAASLQTKCHENFSVPCQRALLPYDWKETGLLVPDVYYVPQIANLDSSHSFYLTRVTDAEYWLVVIQITVGKPAPVEPSIFSREAALYPSRPIPPLAIKASGLEDILCAYPVEVRQRVVRKSLLFVLPAHNLLEHELPIVHATTTQPVDLQLTRTDVDVIGGLRTENDFEQFVCRHVIRE